MEKIPNYYLTHDTSNLETTIVFKINEIVEWINKQEKERE